MTCPPTHERELITVSKAAALIEAKAATARDELFAARLVRHTPFGPRVGVQDLRDWIRSLPTMDREGNLHPVEAPAPPAPPARRGRR